MFEQKSRKSVLFSQLQTALRAAPGLGSAFQLEDAPLLQVQMEGKYPWIRSVGRPLREYVPAPLDGCVPRRVDVLAESVELHVLCDQYREAFLPLAQVLCAPRAAQYVRSDVGSLLAKRHKAIDVGSLDVPHRRLLLPTVPTVPSRYLR